MGRVCRCLLFALVGAALAAPVRAHADTAADNTVEASPKKGWGDFTVVKETEGEEPWWMAVLLWAPNRVLDFIDIFRVDVGFGFSRGAVLRLTKYGQVGYRTMNPASLRIGDFGRRAPYLMEHSSEFGIGPTFVQSKDRHVCTGELGIGADVFVAGAYVGICPEEAVDFLAGIFFLDFEKDDLR
jgi:hypothetical protein